MNAPASHPLFYAARPLITVAGREQPELGAATLGLSVTETLAGLSTLEATFGNWGLHQGEVGYQYFDRALLDFGAEISVDLGAGDARASVFSGRISALEGRFPVERTPEILILAEDRLQDLRMTRRTRSFENTDTQQVISQVLGDQGLQSQIDIEPISYAVVTQLNQTDLAFLRDLARDVDAELWVEARDVHVQARQRRRTQAVDLVYGQTLREFAVQADLAQQASSVVVQGWDVSGKTGISETAEPSALGGELNGGQSGPALLGQALGPREERIVHRQPLTNAEARSLAAARFLRGARRFVTGRGVAEGDGRIRVGAQVRLRELGPLFNGNYYVSEVRHTFDLHAGYRTHFTVERPGLGAN